MGTEVVAKKAGLLGLAEALGNMDVRIQEQVAETGANLGAYMQFSGKTGEYKMNGQPLEYGTVLAFDIMRMQKGIICWKDEKPVKRELVYSLSKDPTPQFPDEADWNEGEDWRTLIEVNVRSLEDGSQASFGLSTKSGVSGLTRLLAEWGQRVRMNLDEKGEPKVCLVEINADKFKTKDNEGKTAWAFAPRFKIVEWVAASELDGGAPVEEPVQGEDTPVQEEVPAQAPVAAAKVAPTPAATAAKRPATGFGSGLRGVRK